MAADWHLSAGDDSNLYYEVADEFLPELEKNDLLKNTLKLYEELSDMKVPSHLVKPSICTIHAEKCRINHWPPNGPMPT